MSRALDALLEGFDEAAHPRGYHGRWIRAGEVIDLFHGADRIGSVTSSGEGTERSPRWFHPAVPGGRPLRDRAGMSTAVASVIAHHQGDRAGFPYAQHEAEAKRVLSSTPAAQDFEAAVKGNVARGVKRTRVAADLQRQDAEHPLLSYVLGRRDRSADAARATAPEGRPRRKSYLSDPRVQPRDPVERVRRIPR